MAELFDPNRPLFSQREGIEPLPEPFKPEHLSRPLRVELANLFDLWIEDNSHEEFGENGRLIVALTGATRGMFRNIFSQLDSYPKSQIDVSYEGVRDRVRRTLLDASFNCVLDLLEASTAQEQELAKVIRYLFDKHKAAYGLIESDGWYRFVPRTSIEDMQCLQQNLTDLSGDRFAPVRDSLHEAITAINARDGDATDFGPAITHCIKSVEAACHIATGDDKASVKDVMRLMPESDMTRHSAFRDAVNKLYGFMSDAPGGRHKGGGIYDLADALYMLSICAAISSYIIQKLPAREG